MANTLIGAIGDLSRVQRWNAMPRVEIWTEAENIAYTTHVAYAVGIKMGMAPNLLRRVLERSLLKSFNKHYLSDVIMSTRDAIRDVKIEAWQELIDHAANVSADLFPRQIRQYVRQYMTYEGAYKIGPEDKSVIEELIKFAQYRTAKSECEINEKVYGDFYKEIMDGIGEKIKKLQNQKRFNDSYEDIKEYLIKIANLKNLRRWNRVNRSVETSVLGHTFIVAFLTLIEFRLNDCKTSLKGEETTVNKEGLLYYSILRALFHDVPETFTGDIISPVKDIIKRKNPGLIKIVERNLTTKFVDTCPQQVQKDIRRYRLLKELKEDAPFTVDSLVKACDKLGIILECLFEIELGKTSREMRDAYTRDIARLQNSEWPWVRELCMQVLNQYPEASIK